MPATIDRKEIDRVAKIIHEGFCNYVVKRDNRVLSPWRELTKEIKDKYRASACAVIADQNKRLAAQGVSP